MVSTLVTVSALNNTKSGNNDENTWMIKSNILLTLTAVLFQWAEKVSWARQETSWGITKRIPGRIWWNSIKNLAKLKDYTLRNYRYGRKFWRLLSLSDKRMKEDTRMKRIAFRLSQANLKSFQNTTMSSVIGYILLYLIILVIIIIIILIIYIAQINIKIWSSAHYTDEELKLIKCIYNMNA